jgi:hypothetical protein
MPRPGVGGCGDSHSRERDEQAENDAPEHATSLEGSKTGTILV